MRQLAFIAIIVLLFSCGGKNDNPDVSDIKVDLTIDRFEQSFFKIDTSQLSQGLAQTQYQFPAVLPLRDTAAYPALRQIIAGYRPIEDSIEKKYKNLDWLRKELVTGFQHVKYYYPSYKLPGVITFIGTFDAPGVVLTPQYLGIGLHQYAGKNFSVYKDPQLQEVYPDYISRRFDREYIVPNSMKALVDDIYPDSSTGRSLVEQMVEKGKQWYLLDKFLPDAPDSLKTGYSQRQLDWVRKNEGNIWGYLTGNTDIYTIDPVVIQDFIGEAPFTRGMPEGVAPGNIGPWVGRQIVRKFAERNTKSTVQEILSTPAKTLFQESKYKPK